MLFAGRCKAGVDPLDDRKCYQTSKLHRLSYMPYSEFSATCQFVMQLIPSVASYSCLFLITPVLEWPLISQVSYRTWVHNINPNKLHARSNLQEKFWQLLASCNEHDFRFVLIQLKQICRHLCTDSSDTWINFDHAGVWTLQMKQWMMYIAGCHQHTNENPDHVVCIYLPEVL